MKSPWLCLVSFTLGVAACSDAASTPSAAGESVAPLPLVAVKFSTTSARNAAQLIRGCELNDLQANYLFDDSAERGTITLSWESSCERASWITLDVEGVATETLRAGRGETMVTTGTRVQDSDNQDASIDVLVRVSTPFGAHTSRRFELQDPIQRCPIPEPDAIAGNEAAFYRCADRWLAQGDGCGADGYPLGYGAVYAEKFYREARPKMSPRGQAWIDAVLVCLQTELQAAIGTGSRCDDVNSMAFATHAGCYTQHGACSLPLRDLLVVANTIERRDVLSKDGLRQVREVLEACKELRATVLPNPSLTVQ